MSAAPNHASIPRRSSADTEGDVQRVFSKLEATGQYKTIQAVIANSPAFFRPFILVSDALMTRSTVPPAVREVVILWMAQRQGATYEWAEHVPMATAVGVTDAQVERLAAGDVGGPWFTDDDRLAVEIARGLLDGEGVATARWAAATERWGLAGALDLVFVVGWWGGFVPTTLAGLGLTEADV